MNKNDISKKWTRYLSYSLLTRIGSIIIVQYMYVEYGVLLNIVST